MSYEVWGEPEEVPECPYCEESAKEQEGMEKVMGDLAQLVQRLAHSLRKAAPDNGLPAKALDYLQREGLAGSPLRDGIDAAPTAIDTAIAMAVIQGAGK